MARKMLFIYNPHSGKGLIKNYLSDILDIFTKAGYDVTVHPTQEGGDLRNIIIASANEYNRIVISGGDGTVNEAVEAVCTLNKDERIELGYIPTGSTNDFAANLGISKDIIEAADIAVGGVPYQCDIGVFNSRHFVYVAAAGAFTAVSYETPQRVKNLIGHSAYIIEGIRSLSTITSIPMRITVEEEERSGKYVICMILNSVRVAGMNLQDYYSVNISDGEFEAVLIEMPESIAALEQALAAVRSGKSKGPGFEVIRGSRFEIETEEPAKWTLDGEFGGEVSKVSISVLPKAVTFIGKGKD